MLKALVRAVLLALVDAKGRKLDDLFKPEKIYVDNTTLMAALVPRVDAGVRRETFFYNQVHKDHVVVHTGVGDFVVDGKWTFEVGGKGKGLREQDSVVAVWHDVLRQRRRGRIDFDIIHTQKR